MLRTQFNIDPDFAEHSNYDSEIRDLLANHAEIFVKVDVCSQSFSKIIITLSAISSSDTAPKDVREKATLALKTIMKNAFGEDDEFDRLDVINFSDIRAHQGFANACPKSSLLTKKKVEDEEKRYIEMVVRSLSAEREYSEMQDLMIHTINNPLGFFDVVQRKLSQVMGAHIECPPVRLPLFYMFQHNEYILEWVLETDGIFFLKRHDKQKITRGDILDIMKGGVDIESIYENVLCLVGGKWYQVKILTPRMPFCFYLMTEEKYQVSMHDLPGTLFEENAAYVDDKKKIYTHENTSFRSLNYENGAYIYQYGYDYLSGLTRAKVTFVGGKQGFIVSCHAPKTKKDEQKHERVLEDRQVKLLEQEFYDGLGIFQKTSDFKVLEDDKFNDLDQEDQATYQKNHQSFQSATNKLKEYLNLFGENTTANKVIKYLTLLFPKLAGSTNDSVSLLKYFNDCFDIASLIQCHTGDDLDSYLQSNQDPEEQPTNAHLYLHHHLSIINAEQPSSEKYENWKVVRNKTRAFHSAVLEVFRGTFASPVPLHINIPKSPTPPSTPDVSLLPNKQTIGLGIFELIMPRSNIPQVIDIIGCDYNSFGTNINGDLATNLNARKNKIVTPTEIFPTVPLNVVRYYVYANMINYELKNVNIADIQRNVNSLVNSTNVVAHQAFYVMKWIYKFVNRITRQDFEIGNLFQNSPNIESLAFDYTDVTHLPQFEMIFGKGQKTIGELDEACDNSTFYNDAMIPLMDCTSHSLSQTSQRYRKPLDLGVYQSMAGMIHFVKSMGVLHIVIISTLFWNVFQFEKFQKDVAYVNKLCTRFDRNKKIHFQEFRDHIESFLYTYKEDLENACWIVKNVPFVCNGPGVRFLQNLETLKNHLEFHVCRWVDLTYLVMKWNDVHVRMLDNFYDAWTNLGLAYYGAFMSGASNLDPTQTKWFYFHCALGVRAYNTWARMNYVGNPPRLVNNETISANLMKEFCETFHRTERCFRWKFEGIFYFVLFKTIQLLQKGVISCGTYGKDVFSIIELLLNNLDCYQNSRLPNPRTFETSSKTTTTTIPIPRHGNVLKTSPQAAYIVNLNRIIPSRKTIDLRKPIIQ